MLKKALLIVLALLVVGLAGGGWWVYGHLGHLVEQAVEEIGPKVTGTDVSLGAATISLFSGEGTLRGLDVGNPKGFSNEEAFELGKIAVAVDVGSVTQDVIHVRSIVVESPRLLAEFDAAGASNLKKILDHARAGRGGGARKPSADGGTPKKLIVDEFRFVGGEVRVVAEAYDLDKELKLPPIQLRNLGGKGGATPADIATQVLRPVVDAAVQAALQEYVAKQRDKLGDKARDKLLEKLGTPR